MATAARMTAAGLTRASGSGMAVSRRPSQGPRRQMRPRDLARIRAGEPDPIVVSTKVEMSVVGRISGGASEFMLSLKLRIRSAPNESAQAGDYPVIEIKPINAAGSLQHPRRRSRKRRRRLRDPTTFTAIRHCSARAG